MSYEKSATYDSGGVFSTLKTKFLTRLTGADQSTIFTDLGTSKLVPTVAGNAKVSTTQSKFGAGALYLDGVNTSKLSWSNSGANAFSLGTSDFTIEGWFYIAPFSGYVPLICMTSSADFQGPIIITETDGTLHSLNTPTPGGWSNGIHSTQVPATNTWVHLAWCRSGNTITLYYQGNSIGSEYTTNSVYTSGTLYIGHYPYFPGGARTLSGYVNDVRITLGSCRYTSNFTPPTSVLPYEEPPQGREGEIRYDANYMYLCVDATTNTWKRVPFTAL